MHSKGTVRATQVLHGDEPVGIAPPEEGESQFVIFVGKVDETGMTNPFTIASVVTVTDDGWVVRSERNPAEPEEPETEAMVSFLQKVFTWFDTGNDVSIRG